MSKYTHKLGYTIPVEVDEIQVNGKWYYLKCNASFDITVEFDASDAEIEDLEVSDENGPVTVGPEDKELQAAIENEVDTAVSKYIEDNAADIAYDVETDYEEQADFARCEGREED